MKIDFVYECRKWIKILKILLDACSLGVIRIMWHALLDRPLGIHFSELSNISTIKQMCEMKTDVLQRSFHGEQNIL